MLKCATSLWSADLANLAAEIRRIEPYSDRFHIDVADGHYTPTLLFFPDLVKAMRPHTKKPFEVHLIVRSPLRWIEPFVNAGADGFIFYPDCDDDPSEVLNAIASAGKYGGISLGLSHELSRIEPHWEQIRVLTIVGTDVGVKGATMDAGVPARIRAARQVIRDRRLSVEIEADGGIRRQSVPLIAAAGADLIVPGSLMFGEDPGEMTRWLQALPGPAD